MRTADKEKALRPTSQGFSWCTVREVAPRRKVSPPKSIMRTSVVYAYLVARANSFLAQSAVCFALGHRSRATYALTHLAPTKHYQCFFPALQGRAARPSVPTASLLHRSSNLARNKRKKLTAYMRTPSLTLAGSLFRRIVNNAPYGSYGTLASENLTKTKENTPREIRRVFSWCTVR